jgi:cell division septal protein FtsQ
MNSYVKSVEVEKIFPSRLKIEVVEYLPFIIFEEENKCKIFSLEGVLLEIQEEIDCESFSQEEGLIYFVGSATLVVVEDGGETFYLTNNIGKVSKVLEQFDIKITSIGMEDNILNISTNSGLIIMDINQDNDVELARLFLVLEELDEQGIKSNSIDVRFERPIIQIDK